MEHQCANQGHEVSSRDVKTPEHISGRLLFNTSDLSFTTSHDVKINVEG